MKPLLILAACGVCISVSALPTYEPFTEFSSAVGANPTNAIDLATGGYTAPSGEQWSGLLYSGLVTAAGQTAGLDVLVTTNLALYTANSIIFPASAVNPLLPAGFPGNPAPGGSVPIFLVNPSQVGATSGGGASTTVGNSAVLTFAQDIPRPASGTKTLYVSYLFSVAQQGQLGAGNDGRYLAFLASSNLVEPSASYPYWNLLFNVFNSSVKYCGHGLLDINASSAYIGACDTSAGKDFSSTPFSTGFGSPNFIVGGYTFSSGASAKDANSIWVNPSPSTFGGPTPPWALSYTNVMAFNMSDIGGICFIDRRGSQASGGVGTNYIANLLIGSTWSYVTGGPEFTNQPANAVGSQGGAASLAAAAVAAGQSVSYQWQRVTTTATNNLTNGLVNPGGGATVSGATSNTLTLTGLAPGDLGMYQVVATANGTGFSLASATATVNADPYITVEPQNVAVAPGLYATFSITASTASPPLSYQWRLNGVSLLNGTQGDGSVVSGATNSVLTISNVKADENGASISCAVTNALSIGGLSTSATLVVADPAFVTQPQPATVNYGGTATFTASVQTATGGVIYAWYKGSVMLANGLQGTGSTASGAQGFQVGGSSTNTLTLSGVSYLDDGNYSLEVTNGANSIAISTAAALTVNDPYIATNPPGTVEVALGGTAHIPVTAYGSGVSYQWYSATGGQLSNSGDDAGVTTATLTISGAKASDAGTYYVVSSGNNGSVQSSNAVLYVDTAVTGVTLTPPRLTQQAGTHLALVGAVAGAAGGLVHYLWKFNGTYLNNGAQPDGSTILGVGTSALVLSNLHVADSGTYTLIASNAANAISASNAVTVSAGFLPLAASNLVVTRVGDGVEALSGATGNTLYLDQFQSNGTYVSTLMVPDFGPSALIVPGPATGGDGTNEAFLTLSSNQAYLNFVGYCLNYPYAGTDVTGAGIVGARGIAAVDALGYFTLAYTNWGILSGGNHFARSVYSTDGLTNFWVGGGASDAIDYVQAGPGGSSYAAGTGVPYISSASNVRCLGLLNRNLVFSDNVDAGLLGLNAFVGAPELFSTTLNFITSVSPADFAVSPDTNTVYVADDSPAIAGGESLGGGIQRWDWTGGSYSYSYTLEDTSGQGTNGARGLAVLFPSNITAWGPNVEGALVYATTSETVSNRLIRFVDNGVSSTPTVLATAGPNQFLQGVRFGPVPLPISIVASTSSLSADVGASNELSVIVSGDAPLFYQWQLNGTNIAGATSSSLVFTNLQVTNSGTYTAIIANAISTNTSTTVLSVVAAPPAVVTAPLSRVETVGDHLAFTVSATGTQPISYQWQSNGAAIAGATSTSYSLSNIVVANSATYSVLMTNIFGTNTATASLLVTPGLQPLSSNNLVVVRVGDGVQALSSSTGNTVYLDQYTTAGVYSNTIMASDNVAASALIVPGGTTEAPYGSVLTLSASGAILNFVGFNTTRPAVASFSGSALYRCVASVNTFGYYTIQDNDTIYNALDIFDSAVSLDGYTQFWTTGSASSPPGVKYATTALAGPGGGNRGLGGSASGTRVINIVAGNVVYSDTGSSPPGIWAFSGEPATAATPSVLISEPAGSSPNDFAASPDTTSFPPFSSTVYVGDNRSIASGGGVQRYDWTGSAYVLSYTLGTGSGSAVGASDLTVDFSSHATWGPGVTGAIIYATTAETSGDRLIKIVDAGSNSTAAVLAAANANEILRGVRFGPIPGSVVIATNPSPQSPFVGGEAVFTVAAQNGPFTYQWQLNGTNLVNGPSLSGSGAVVSGAQSATLIITNIGGLDDGGNYSVVVSNPNPSGSASSSSVLLSVPVEITSFPPATEYVVKGGTAVITVGATGGLPLSYQWSGGPYGGVLFDGPSASGSGAVISGASTASLTISNVGLADASQYYVTVANNDPSSATTSAQPTTLVVLTVAPQFASSGPITGLGTASAQLNFSGQAGAGYRIWVSTNVALEPVVGTWTLVGSGTFSGGADHLAISPGIKSQFFVITQP